MEFTYKGKNYRLYRGIGSGNWLLLGEVELPLRNGEFDWRIINSFEASVHDVDAIDHAKNLIDQTP
jgi:hypothetical protein